MLQTIGCITIGLAPRPDLLTSLPRGFELLEEGVLNQLPREKWEEVRPDPESPFLVSQVEEREVFLDSRKIKPYLEQAAISLVQRGAEMIIYLCSAPLPRVQLEIPQLIPFALTRPLLDNLLPRGNLGLIIPDFRQKEMFENNWQETPRKLFLLPHSPYGVEGFSRDEIKILEKCDLILADCLGYDLSLRLLLQGQITTPIILIRELLGLFLQQMQSGPKKSGGKEHEK